MSKPNPKLAAWQQSLLQQTPPIEIPTMPLLNNSDGTNWLTDKMAAMLKKQHGAPAPCTASGGSTWRKNHFAGLVVDFEEIPKKSQKDFTQFISELAQSCTTSNLKLMVCLPAAD